MATVLDFPKTHKLDAQWAVMASAVQRAAEANQLDEKRAELLMVVMKADWAEFFAQSASLPLPRRELRLATSLTESDTAALHDFVSAKAQDAADTTWLHFVGLFHVLLWERASVLAQGAQLRVESS